MPPNNRVLAINLLATCPMRNEPEAWNQLDGHDRHLLDDLRNRLPFYIDPFELQQLRLLARRFGAM